MERKQKADISTSLFLKFLHQQVQVASFNTLLTFELTSEFGATGNWYAWATCCHKYKLPRVTFVNICHRSLQVTTPQSWPPLVAATGPYKLSCFLCQWLQVDTSSYCSFIWLLQQLGTYHQMGDNLRIGRQSPDRETTISLPRSNLSQVLYFTFKVAEV